MEDIIIAIVITLIGGIIGYIKEKQNKPKPELKRTMAPPPFPEPAVPEPVHHEKFKIHVPEPAKKREQKPERKTVEYKPIEIQAEEGARVTTDNGSPMTPVERKSGKAAAEHYARWRQSIIDSQILTPKF